jgi:hypothetical protein
VREVASSNLAVPTIFPFLIPFPPRKHVHENSSVLSRLFHVSEESGITTFHPRPVASSDTSVKGNVVWAIDETHLPNYLLPRDCPRIAFRISKKTTETDKKRFFSASTTTHVIALESDWQSTIEACSLCAYGFDPEKFESVDATAGYYISRSIERIVTSFSITDILSELRKRNVEVRFVKDLWGLRDEVLKSSLEFSIIRFRNAKPKVR